MNKKLILLSFLILVNSSKQKIHARNYFEKRFLERGLSKNLTKVNLIFSFAPSYFYRQDYEKQKRPGTSYQFLLGLQNMFRIIPFFVF